MQEQEQQISSAYMIGGAVVVAGLIIAGAIVYSNNPGTSGPGLSVGENNNDQTEIIVNPVNDQDHILGDPSAPVKIVEFSDLECPFCTRFHQTMMDEIKPDYIDTGKVAWVYRHYPLDQLHPEARIKAQASECVAKFGGNEAFWSFVDDIFNGDETANDLSSMAVALGINEADFNSCVSSQEVVKAVDDEAAQAVAAGAKGTPYSIVIAADGSKSLIPGALPASQVKSILDQALSK